MTTDTDEANTIAQQYICIDPRLGRKLYRYYNNALSKQEASGFEEHLIFCFKCQEAVFKLDAIFDELSANREQWIGSDGRFEKKSDAGKGKE